VRFPVLKWAMGCTLLLIATQSGCSTVLGIVNAEDEEEFRSKIFVGIRVAAWGMSGGPEGGLEYFLPCWLVDSIPSLAADIVLLPFTLLYELFRSREPWKKPNAPGP